MKTLLAVILIVAIAGGAYWYVHKNHPDDIQQMQDQAARKTEHVTDAVKDKLKDLSAGASETKQELEKAGETVRKKAEKVGGAIADVTADARITTTIKAKLVKDPNLSALRISVNTTDGIVTLSGSVSSEDEVGQAKKLALETDGVKEAISTLQVKSAK